VYACVRARVCVPVCVPVCLNVCVCTHTCAFACKFSEYDIIVNKDIECLFTVCTYARMIAVLRVGAG